ncbi:hypothetical protein F383_10766 [Gossypium arboreum]|uniref:Uncharacterized protein n=1 Tax=Gossypium arboreum TaxID=29729 RepID=A0A0B0NW74_GOSAR|nr:hypothetical protein F383_10766 [Gossypium arboreum]
MTLCYELVQYRQASSGTKGRRRLDHTINWTIGIPSSKHTGRDTAVCRTWPQHGRVPKSCEVST